jgi:ATP/maltotriose-dependent transcriptional regulator MalT
VEGSKTHSFITEILSAAGIPTRKLADLLPAETLDSLAVASTITERELDVLRLVGKGCSNQEIGQRLTIAAGTVKTHFANIYRKLDVHNRVQAVAVAQALNLL